MSYKRLESAIEELRICTGREPSPDMASAMQEMLAALPSDATTRFHDYSDEGDDKKCHDNVLGFIYRKHTMACFTLYDDGVRASVCYNGRCVQERLTTARAIEMLLAPHTEDYGNVVVTPVDGGVRIEYLGRKTKLMAGDCFEIDNKKIKIVYRGEQRRQRSAMFSTRKRRSSGSLRRMQNVPMRSRGSLLLKTRRSRQT